MPPLTIERLREAWDKWSSESIGPRMDGVFEERNGSVLYRFSPYHRPSVLGRAFEGWRKVVRSYGHRIVD